MSDDAEEEKLLRVVALQNAQSIRLARREAEDALQKQSEWLRITLASIGDAVISTDAEGRITFLNGVAETLTGWPQAEALGRPLPDVFHIVNEATRQEVENPALRALRDGVIVGLANHTILIAKDGTERPIDDSAAPLLDGSRRLLGAVLVFRDISEKHEAAKQLQESQDHLKSVFDSAAEGLCVVAPDGRCTYLNAAGATMLGYRPEEVTGRDLHEVVHHHYPDGSALPVAECRIARAAREGAKVRVDDEVFWRKDGTPVPVVYSASPMEVGGKKAGAVVTFSDVTARRQAEAERRAAEQRTRTVLESITEGFVAVDSEWRFTYLNAQAEKIYDTPREQLIGKNLWEAFPEALDTVFEREYRRAMSDRSATRVEAPFERLNGWFEVNVYPIQDGGLSFYFRDVTERRQAEDAKERRARQLQKLADISARINAAHDVHSVIGVVTEEARNLIGARQAATNMVLTSSYPQPLTVISTASTPSYERTSPSIDGAELYGLVNEENRPVRLTQDQLGHDPRWQTLKKVALAIPTASGWLAVPFIGRNGKSMGLLQLADKEEGEFTEEDEAILVQLSRLATVAVENARLYEELRVNDQRKDEFLAMLAHELRNPLAAIGNAVRVTTRSGHEHIDWSIDVITRQMRHLTRLIDDLMDVSRISCGKIDLRKEVLDATPILDSAAATVRPLVEERKHTLDVSVDRGTLWVNVDPTRLEQVVVNLLNNAAKYRENAGHIQLLARNDGNEVVISVKDKGIGIPPEKLPDMFELFTQGDRSLARSEGGLGIGLTVVKKLVEMHGGTITATSKGNGKGSEFIVRLPAAKKPSKVKALERTTAEQPGRKARILVVDDNVDTARGMARLLQLLGHEIATAHSGPEAIEVAKDHRPEFILLDIGLPGMNGYEVASKLRQEECCKEAVIVAVSGYGQDEDRRRSKDAGFDFHLTKPLDHDALFSLLSAGANR